MTKPYKPEDPRYFTTYSDKPYDRHNYRIVLKNGDTKTVDDYEVARAIWYHYKEKLSHIEVVDKLGFK